MGTTLTHRMTETHHDMHSFSTTWIPRAVRCPRCQEIAHEAVRERLSDDEVAVRYGCSACSWQQTRYYHESEMEHDRL